MRVGMKDVAALAGVSKTAVSLYLNNHPHAKKLAPNTRLKIDDAIRKTGYKPSATARALTSGKTRTLGLVVGGIANEYFAHFAEAALEESSRRGYQLMVSLTRWNKEEEQRSLENLIDRQTDGILYYPFLSTDSKIYRDLSKSSYPLLLIEQESDVFRTITNDIDSALKEAVVELKRLGHSEIYGVFGDFSEWRTAFEAAKTECDFEGRQLDVLLASVQERIATVKEILRIRPSALIMNGRLTTNMLLQEISRHCPDYKPDIIVSYDFPSDVPHNELVVGVIYCHSTELAKKAVTALIDMVENNNDQISHTLITAEFIAKNQFSEKINDEYTSQWHEAG